jgi:GntR family transcriptional regulator, rspAB operon transcriptional repressor
MRNGAADAIIDLVDAEHHPEHADTQGARAYREIRRAILECRLAPGSTIDEKSLMTEFGFGRTPVREALLRLSCVKLVHFAAGQAIQVAPIGLQDIRDLYEDRLHSERLAAFLAVKRLTAEGLHALKHNFDGVPAMIKAGKLGAAIALDFRFHSLIYHAAHNAMLSEHLHNLFAHSYRLWHLTARREPREMAAIIKSHEPIIDALARRDAAKLDGLIVEHISQAFERLLNNVKGDAFSGIARMNVIPLSQSSAP